MSNRSGGQLFVDLDKLKKVYLSCITVEQIKVANKMAEAFEKKWKGNVGLSQTSKFFLTALGSSFSEMRDHKESIINNGNSLHNT